jgi:prevent-host-death family protein
MSSQTFAMNTIPATEAKAHFSALLDSVAKGEEFVLTRHGRDFAYLGPAKRATAGQAAQAVAALEQWRSKVAARGRVLAPGESIKALISRGRC